MQEPEVSETVVECQSSRRPELSDYLARDPWSLTFAVTKACELVRALSCELLSSELSRGCWHRILFCSHTVLGSASCYQ